MLQVLMSALSAFKRSRAKHKHSIYEQAVLHLRECLALQISRLILGQDIELRGHYLMWLLGYGTSADVSLGCKQFTQAPKACLARQYTISSTRMGLLPHGHAISRQSAQLQIVTYAAKLTLWMLSRLKCVTSLLVGPGSKMCGCNKMARASSVRVLPL